MQQQVFEWDPPPARLAYRGATHTAVVCSRTAAIAAQAFSGSQEACALAWWRAQGPHGGTDPECHAATKIGRASLCLRRRALIKAGLLVDGHKSRPHRSGKRSVPCTVWVAREFAQG